MSRHINRIIVVVIVVVIVCSWLDEDGYQSWEELGLLSFYILAWDIGVKSTPFLTVYLPHMILQSSGVYVRVRDSLSYYFHYAEIHKMQQHHQGCHWVGRRSPDYVGKVRRPW